MDEAGRSDLEQRSGPRPVWGVPWGLREGLLVSFGLVAVGFGLQLVVPNLVSPAIVWPLNAWLFGGLLAALTLGQVLLGRRWWLRWLGSIPAAVGATVGFACVALLLGVVPQVEASQAGDGGWVSRLGLDAVTGSWPYLLAVAWFLVVLGAATVRRVWPIGLQNIGYFLCHGGLFLAVAGAHLGAGDLQRLTLHLKGQQPTWSGVDRQGTEHELDFALKLNRFDIQEYPAELGIVDSVTGALQGGARVELPAKGAALEFQGWKLTLVEYLESAAEVGQRYVAVQDLGTARAALVTATRVADGARLQGWISCGSFMRQVEVLKLEAGKALVMLPPRPKRFLSEATLYRKDGPTRTITLEVNKPESVNGWKLYQLSYDQEMGRWSDVSILEAVRDPWLPLVYCGIFLLIAGSVWLAFLGLKERS